MCSWSRSCSNSHREVMCVCVMTPKMKPRSSTVFKIFIWGEGGQKRDNDIIGPHHRPLNPSKADDTSCLLSSFSLTTIHNLLPAPTSQWTSIHPEKFFGNSYHTPTSSLWFQQTSIICHFPRHSSEHTPPLLAPSYSS